MPVTNPIATCLCEIPFSNFVLIQSVIKKLRHVSVEYVIRFSEIDQRSVQNVGCEPIFLLEPH